MGCYAARLGVATAIILSQRDVSLLRLLSWTPATTALVLRASTAFDGDPFLDERRVRERLQTMAKAGLVRAWSATLPRGGLQNYYKLTSAGFQAVTGVETELPPRTFFAEISPALYEHTLRLAAAIIETVRACAQYRVTLIRVFRENELTFTVGREQVQPDCFFRLQSAGKPFNFAFEVDQSTESLDSFASKSIRTKLRIYDAYQEQTLEDWRTYGKVWERPRYRVVFLTRTVERAYHILALAKRVASNPARRLIYATTLDAYLSDPDPLHTALCLDHDGSWRSLIDHHPSAPVLRSPVRLPNVMEPGSPF